MGEYKLNSIEDAIKDFKEGKFVIVVDDEDRENEGDLIIAAEKIDAEKVNFMLKNARGVLCAPITLSRCDELDLPHQVSDNTSMLGTPFTVTVDKLEGCTTGVSAHDRAETIKALADPASTPQTFGRPGHINPIYTQDNGVLRRSGHTKAAIDLCRMACLYPAGALMEIMNEDGSMARLPQLMEMAKEWHLKVISIKDMIEDNIRVDYNKLRMLIRHDKEFAHDASIIQQLVTQGFVIGTLNENFPAERINDPDNFLSLLFYFGMVTIDGDYKGVTKFIIPNEAVRDQMYTYLLDTYKENDLTYDSFNKGKLESQLAYDGHYKAYFEFIADSLKRYSSQRDKQKGEAFVHGFTLAMTSQNQFYRFGDFC